LIKKLNTEYLGLDLVSPVIAGSSGMTMSIEKVKILVDSGVGAIVLKSVFEEEINKKALTMETATGNYPETRDYILAYTKNKSPDQFISEWMDKNGFESVEDFRGQLNYSKISDPELYERTKFMKYFSV
jgi:dihydroorotate dehydrogenase